MKIIDSDGIEWELVHLVGNVATFDELRSALAARGRELNAEAEIVKAGFGDNPDPRVIAELKKIQDFLTHFWGSPDCDLVFRRSPTCFEPTIRTREDIAQQAKDLGQAVRTAMAEDVALA